MLNITTEPAGYAAAGGTAEYRIETDGPKTLDVKITDAETEELLGAKRYAEASEAQADAASIVQRHIRFAPEAGRTGFIAAKDRRRAVKAEAAAGTETATSGICIYHAGDGTAEAPALLTTLPLQRLIGPDECDEITLLTTNTPRMRVRATGPAGTTERNYTTPNTTLHVFRLAAADFPEAERIELATDEGLTVSYTVLAPPKGSRRVAWRTRAGSLEHYTFPTETETTVKTTKKRIRTPEGPATLTTESERRLRLRSAYETREMLEALAEIMEAPQVWLAEEAGYTPVVAATDEATVHRHGVMSLLELEIAMQR